MKAHGILMSSIEADAFERWETLREIEREHLQKWMADLESHPIPQFHKIGALLKEAVDIWDEIVMSNLPNVSPERWETYTRSIPHAVQYLCYRLYHLGRLSGVEVMKACISCGKPIFAYRAGTRFCSPRCFSVYELFLRQLNSLFEIIREQYYPSREAWNSCIICGGRALRWYRTKGGGWKIDWVNALKNPRGITRDRKYAPDRYKQVCQSPFCNWAAANLRKMLKEQQKNPLTENEIEERIERFRKWIAKVKDQNYTPHISMLKAELEAIAEAFERAIAVYTSIYIIFANKLPPRYELFNDPIKVKYAVMASMHIPLIPARYKNFFLNVIAQFIERDVPKALDHMLERWSMAVNNPEVTLTLPLDDMTTTAFKSTLAEAFALIETTPLVELDNEHLDSPFEAQEVIDRLQETVKGWRETNQSRIEEILKTALKRAETEGVDMFRGTQDKGKTLTEVMMHD